MRPYSNGESSGESGLYSVELFTKGTQCISLNNPG